MSTSGGTIDRSSTANEPFGPLLARYLSPFWLFKDATRGDRYARAAAYRHNRSMRMHLPCYLRRWTLTSFLAFGLIAAFDSLAHGGGAANTSAADVFLLLAAGGGLLFASCLCMLAVIGYIYLYLGRHER